MGCRPAHGHHISEWREQLTDSSGFWIAVLVSAFFRYAFFHGAAHYCILMAHRSTAPRCHWISEPLSSLSPLDSNSSAIAKEFDSSFAATRSPGFGSGGSTRSSGRLFDGRQVVGAPRTSGHQRPASHDSSLIWHYRSTLAFCLK